MGLNYYLVINIEIISIIITPFVSSISMSKYKPKPEKNITYYVEKVCFDFSQRK